MCAHPCPCRPQIPSYHLEGAHVKQTLRRHRSYTVQNRSRTVPNHSRTVPDRSHTVPKRSCTVPNSVRAVPNRSRTVPNRSRIVPAEANAVSNQSERTSAGPCTRATSEAIGNGSLGNLVELRIPELWARPFPNYFLFQLTLSRLSLKPLE